MTKIAYFSDCHLEFGERNFDLPDADILILAGDILVAADLDLRMKENKTPQIYRNFFQDVSEKYQTVLYTGGNHEHYHGVIDKTKKLIDATLADLEITNIHYNDTGVYTVNDLTIVYATMWTDMKNNDPYISYVGGSSMNDYRKISLIDSPHYGLQRLNPADTYNIHINHAEFIEKNVAFKDKVVVFTHHAPNMESRMYDGDVSYMYCCTTLDEMIYNNPQIKYWIHGHTHKENNYMIAETNVLSNPRGYIGHQEIADTFTVKVIDV